MRLTLNKVLITTVTAALLGGTVQAIAAAEVFMPVLSYRTGPYAPNGIPVANGFVDYLKLINARDGGVNGVKIAFEECEFGYATAKGVECYERLKSKKPVAVWPLSTGVTFALTPKAPEDRIPIMTPGYGLSFSTDGSVFEWNFPLFGTYYTAADVLIQHLAKLEKGDLKGKKIAFIYHDSPYGKDPLPVLEKRAEMMGFELLKLPVTHPGLEQKATWLQVRQERPNYVLLWGWGAMNSAAIKEATAVGYPRSQMYGVWWSAAEPDVLPAEEAAKGYNGLTLQQSSENDKPVHKDVVKYLHSKGQGTGAQEEIGTVLYNRGLTQAMLVVEAIRTAQAKTGKKVVTGSDVRLGFENLDITEARIKAMGFQGMLQPLKTSCSDHTGVYSARIHTWNGKAWEISSDWYTADKSVIGPIIEDGAKKFAAEQKITPRKCG